MSTEREKVTFSCRFRPRKFRELSFEICDQYTVAFVDCGTIKFLTTRLEKTKDSMMACVITAMGEVDWVATTTDCWTAHHRSFLGVTAHWLNKENMKRESAALACRRLTGKHDYQLLGKELCKVHDQFQITEKVIRTTTDDGSNFVKAFSVFSPSEDENEECQGHVSVNDALNSSN